MEDQIISKLTSLEENTDKRFTSLEENTDKRFTSLDSRITSLEEKMDKRITSVEETVDRVAIEVASLGEDMTEVKDDIKDLKSMKSGIDAILKSQDVILKMLKDDDIERASTKNALDRHEDRIGKLEDGVDKLKLQVQTA